MRREGVGELPPDSEGSVHVIVTTACKLRVNSNSAMLRSHLECDVQADVREIVKVERFSYDSLTDTKAAEAVSFVDQLELPLTGHNQSGNEPLQDEAGNHTSGTV